MTKTWGPRLSRLLGLFRGPPFDGLFGSLTSDPLVLVSPGQHFGLPTPDSSDEQWLKYGPRVSLKSYLDGPRKCVCVRTIETGQVNQWLFDVVK